MLKENKKWVERRKSVLWFCPHCMHVLSSFLHVSFEARRGRSREISWVTRRHGGWQFVALSYPDKSDRSNFRCISISRIALETESAQRRPS